MATIQWRPEPNPLTTPPSWRIRFMPRNTAGCNDIAADIAADHPNYNEELAESILELGQEKILRRLINGENVTFTNAFSYTLSLTGRLEGPDDPLPPLDECLHIRVHAAPALVEALRQAAHLERLPPEKKLPLISTAQDTVLGLKDVLNPQGLLRLVGEDMDFDRTPGGGECVIEGTAGGRTVQTRFGKVEASEIILMPDVPSQPHPWNNEYTVSVSTRYSERGTLRTGTYERLLRAPLTVPGLSSWTGILTGKAAAAHVSITGGTASADTSLRIQVVLDLQGERLLFSLLDMKEGGTTGAAVSVTANGAVTLPGFAGSAVTSMEITVNSYAALWEMVHNDYGGRLVDVLKIETA
uniref:hypothetical protein n=1 Tax=Candidatus Electronema sp. TaxID=2698783 RepID=UPI0040577AD8